MTENEKLLEIEARANDLIGALTKQRDGALNAVVQLEAVVSKLQRDMQSKDSAIEQLKAENDQLKAEDNGKISAMGADASSALSNGRVQHELN